MSQDARYAAVSFAWLALALGAPVLVYHALRPRPGPRSSASPWLRAGRWVATLATAVTISPAALLLGVCAGPPPGESDAARAAKAASGPLIAALERYRAERGAYPATLDALTPAYAPAAAALAVRADPGEPLEYQVDSTGYELRFRYTGPGRNYCTYGPRQRTWRCGGYF